MFFQKILTFSLIFTALITLTACSNTLSGAGSDIKGAGEWMEETFWDFAPSQGLKAKEKDY